MKGIGILPGRNLSYVDHLVPLCHILNFPILVTDNFIKELIEIYYPPLPIIFADPEDYNLDPYLQDYDIFLYVDFFRKGNGSFRFRKYTTTKKARSVMSLHGNPDKFWQIYWLENLCDEDIVLVYGEQLRKLMQEKKIGKSPIICGNYRLEFYKAHRQFFDQKVPFCKEKSTILYAPTWSVPGRLTEHSIHFSTFLDDYYQVFDLLSEQYQLLVKIHPHMVKRMPYTILEIKEQFPHIDFLEDFPLIYPLLQRTDYYLGDYSSIGYDFLYYDRPLFFLETNEETALQSYGVRIKKEQLQHLQQLSQKQFARKEYYKMIFEDKKLDNLKKEIEELITQEV